MLFKTCLACDTAKPTNDFAKNKAKGDGLQYRCKACCAVYRAENKEKVQAQKKEHYYKNKERLLAEKRSSYQEKAGTKRMYQRLYFAKNRETVLAKNKLFHENNPDYYAEFRKRFPAKVNAKEVRRKTAKIQRTPSWLSEEDFWVIEQAYELAAIRTKMFGFSWHVDHIIPLRGRTVSGFHGPNNLQVIPWRDNVLKSNIYKV